jgi:hypothetical protein
VKEHIQNDNIKLKASDWSPNTTQALWDHMLRLWKYRNDALHEVAQFQVEALDRDIERLEARHEDLRSKLRTFQEQHIMQRVEHYYLKTLQHNSRKCCASLAKLYLDEAEHRIETDIAAPDGAGTNLDSFGFMIKLCLRLLLWGTRFS